VYDGWSVRLFEREVFLAQLADLLAGEPGRSRLW
jgi:hypothetical protein